LRNLVPDLTRTEQSPSLLTIILDTNPGAWALLSDTVSLSSAVANLLIFINAHLASNYTNKVAVVASHCNKAQWLYPSPTEQLARITPSTKRRSDHGEGDQLSETTKRLKINGSQHASPNGAKSKDASKTLSHSSSNTYRPFRLVEEELLSNLTTLLNATLPEDVSSTTSTKIAGALTLALSYINRETIAYSESTNGPAANDPTPQTNLDSTQQSQGTLQSRIFILTVSPTSDLAHQYIPIMNTIFACQRLSIPIDICQIPLPTPTTSPSSTTTTVFLQQASDATHGIYILIPPAPKPGLPPPSLLIYLMTAFLPSPSSRTHLILPTSISVDFRAACFCHRNIVDIGFVCSICLSIFCSVPDNGDCLTCGTHLSLGEYGGAPVVVARKKKRRRD
jgi:transcription initiation factor TFIIH subunit 3